MKQLENLHGKAIRCPKCKSYGIFRYYPATGLSAVAHGCGIRGLVTTAQKWCALDSRKTAKIGQTK